ncbi:hypothetical protein DFS34DRAFT_513473 [Phlyctochytrium arcticum]|nr:hypothetical protein DFS34DRAFT_513473 [Phlyctochytrium arcticum]
MSDKKMNYKDRQALSFSAAVPDFLRQMQAHADANQTGRRKRDGPPRGPPGDDSEDSGPDRPDADDEKPQMVVEKGITDFEVRNYLGTDVTKDGGSSKKRGAEDEDEEDDVVESSEGEMDGDGKPKFRKPRRKKVSGMESNAGVIKKRQVDARKKDALAKTKKIKNKTLLSFGDDE